MSSNLWSRPLTNTNQRCRRVARLQSWVSTLGWSKSSSWFMGMLLALPIIQDLFLVSHKMLLSVLLTIIIMVAKNLGESQISTHNNFKQIISSCLKHLSTWVTSNKSFVSVTSSKSNTIRSSRQQQHLSLSVTIIRHLVHRASNVYMAAWINSWSVLPRLKVVHRARTVLEVNCMGYLNQIVNSNNCILCQSNRIQGNLTNNLEVRSEVTKKIVKISLVNLHPQVQSASGTLHNLPDTFSNSNRDRIALTKWWAISSEVTQILNHTNSYKWISITCSSTRLGNNTSYSRRLSERSKGSQGKNREMVLQPPELSQVLSKPSNTFCVRLTVSNSNRKQWHKQ